MTPKLTVNAGLRWEIYEPEWVSGPRRGGFVDFTTGNIRTAGVGSIGLNMNVENSFRNFVRGLGLHISLGRRQLCGWAPAGRLTLVCLEPRSVTSSRKICPCSQSSRWRRPRFGSALLTWRRALPRPNSAALFRRAASCGY